MKHYFFGDFHAEFGRVEFVFAAEQVAHADVGHGDENTDFGFLTVFIKPFFAVILISERFENISERSVAERKRDFADFFPRPGVAFKRAVNFGQVERSDNRHKPFDRFGFVFIFVPDAVFVNVTERAAYADAAKQVFENEFVFAGFVIFVKESRNRKTGQSRVYSSGDFFVGNAEQFEIFAESFIRKETAFAEHRSYVFFTRGDVDKRPEFKIADKRKSRIFALFHLVCIRSFVVVEKYREHSAYPYFAERARYARFARDRVFFEHFPYGISA